MGVSGKRERNIKREEQPMPAHATSKALQSLFRACFKLKLLDRVTLAGWGLGPHEGSDFLYSLHLMGVCSRVSIYITTDRVGYSQQQHRWI